MPVEYFGEKSAGKTAGLQILIRVTSGNSFILHTGVFRLREELLDRAESNENDKNTKRSFKVERRSFRKSTFF